MASSVVTARKLRPLVKRHGGKAYLARRILALFPEHETYVEPFAGGLSVLLNKSKSPIKVASDLDAGLMLAYETLQSKPRELIGRLRALPYDVETFEQSKTLFEPGAGLVDVDLAVAIIVRNRFSRGGLGRDFAWSERLRGGQPGDANAWQTIVAELPSIAERLAGVRILTRDACETMSDYDSPGTVHYVDPPYPHETRTATKAYAHEMTRDDHIRLLDCLLGLRGRVFLSGYRNALYDDRLVGWTRWDFEMPNHAGQGKTKQRRVECVWESPER